MADDGHETAERVLIPAGGVESDQVAPPFCVTMIEATEPELAPLSPTATQVAELAEALGAHDTALTLASGGYPAVVCHVGVTAPAGDIDARLPTMPKRASASTDDSATRVVLRSVRIVTSVGNGDPTSDCRNLRPPLLDRGCGSGVNGRR
jgi:hypothetical protein